MTYTEDERREPLRQLLKEALPNQDAASNQEVATLSGTQLRDRLIAHNPLDKDWIARINEVQALCLYFCLVNHKSCYVCCSMQGKKRVWQGSLPASKLPETHVLLQAEAELWKRSEGYRVGWSDQILGFDCGGEQWVLEVAFPTGTLK